MRLATFVAGGQDCLGLVRDGQITDVTAAIPNMMAFVQSGLEGRRIVEVAAARGPRIPIGEVQLRAPFPRPVKNILCLGLNYQDHVGESERAGYIPPTSPKTPLWFTKAVTSVCGPFDDIVIDPALSTKYDWEVELAVVIGKSGRDVPKERAFDMVFGYTAFNDFSVRDVQLRGTSPQWFLGKSYDHASPMGPWIVTADEIGTPPRLDLSCRVNGIEKQRSNTERFIFDIPAVIADITRLMTLEVGDIIATGTPAGVGISAEPPQFLSPGDILETEIAGIGTMRNRIVETAIRSARL